MPMYPVQLDIRDKHCVIVGGGPVAERKALRLLDYGACLTLISPNLTERLHELVNTGRATWLEKNYDQSAGDLGEAFLVFAATDSPAVQATIIAEASQANILINVADAPGQSSFHLPALLSRGDLTITISTNGMSPALAARIRKQLEGDFGEEYALLLQVMGVVREYVQEHVESKKRKAIFHDLLDSDLLLWLKTSEWEKVEQHLQAVLGPSFYADLSFLRNMS